MERTVTMNNVDRMFTESNGAAEFARRYVEYLSLLLAELNVGAVEEFAQILEKAQKAGRTVFLVGNGGSAATALHWANDLMLGTRAPGTPALRVMSLTDNMAMLTALANDREYADVFVGQLEPMFRPGDVLVAISASGNSANVVRAVEYANGHGGTTVGLLGFDGDTLKALCRLAIVVATPQGEYGPVEDVHMVLDHIMMSWLKGRFRESA